MRVFARSFGSCLGFAAAAAVSLPVLLMVGAPVLGTATVLAGYMVTVSAAYVAWIAPNPRLALSGGVAVTLGGSFICLLVPGSGVYSLSLLAIGCAALVAVMRSAVFYRSRSARAIVLELGLSLGGLWVARFLGGTGMLSMAAAMWGYLLVQSFYGLAPGLRLRRDGSAGGDAFERASSRLSRLLEEAP